MNFSEALQLLKDGKTVARLGWNKCMYLYLVPGSLFKVNRPPLNQQLPPGTEVQYTAHIDMCTADGSFSPWVASQTDLLSSDWTEVKPMGLSYD